MKVLWALLCGNVITDQRTNNVSLIEIIEQITVPAPPPGSVAEVDGQSGTLFNMRIVVLWARSDRDVPEKGQARVRMIAPDGKESQSMEHEVDLIKLPRVRAIGHIVGFPFPLTHEGEHFFRVEKQTADSTWKTVFELPVWVQIQTDSPSG